MTTKIISGTYSAGYSSKQTTNVLSITASGYIGGAGLVVNPPSGTDTVFNLGTISGSTYGVESQTVYKVRLTNGASNDIQARIDGGISLYSAGAVTNFGTIIGSQARDNLAVGVSNGHNGRGAGSATVVNGSASDTAALIDGSVDFVYGSLFNYGTIDLAQANMFGAAVSPYLANSLVTNFGAIEGGRADKIAGVTLSNGGTLVNGSASDHAARIYGYVGVRANDAATVTNFGTIEGAGGDAVEFSSAYATLVVEAGSTFIGKVVDDAGGGTLDLANGSGTINSAGSGAVVVSGDMPAATFTGFGTVDIAAGATFAVTGSLTVAAGQTFAVAGTLAGAGRLAINGGTIDFTSTSLLQVADVYVYASSVVNVGAARLVYAGDWTQIAGALTVAAGDMMVFTGASDRISGSLAGAGLVDFSAGAVALDTVTIDGEMEITETAVATLSGLTMLSTGALLKITAPKVLIASGGATLAGGGRFILEGASTVVGATVSTTLTNQDDLIAGGGALGGGQLILVNDAAGIIDGFFPIALTIDTGANAVANAGLIEATGAGGVVIKSTVHNSGTLFANGGNLTVDGAVSGAGVARIRAATADFNGAFSEDVSFIGSGTLEMADSRAYGGTITGFSRTGGTSLDLVDIAFGGGAKASFSGTAKSGVLTVTDGTHTAHITLIGNYLSSTFIASSDGHGGVSVVDSTTKDLPAPPSAPAFVAAMASFGALPASAGSASEHAQAWRAQLLVPRAQSQ